jgi:uncharacterized metal-binding protein
MVLRMGLMLRAPSSWHSVLVGFCLALNQEAVALVPLLMLMLQVWGWCAACNGASRA